MPPGHHFIIGLPDLETLSVTELSHDIEVQAKIIGVQKCLQCESTRYRIKSSFWRRLKHSRQGNRIIWLRIRSHKFLCLRCGAYFNARLRGIYPRKRSTETFRHEVFEQHQGGITQLALSRTHLISPGTVERWYRDFIWARVKELSSRSCPKILGIDEHFFTRKKGYATTLVDLNNRYVFDVVLGRSEVALGAYLQRLKDRHLVKIVVMDLSETYRALVKKYFPNALIVSDRFHVVRLINHHFLKSWQSFDPAGRKNRGLLSLMRRHQWNLSDDQLAKLERYLKSHPALEALYGFKQDLLKLMLQKTLDKTAIRPKLYEFLERIQDLLESPIEPMKALGKTLERWKEEVVRMWRFKKTNSITEGFHNKMEMISRRAFGFRNFQNYRLRVLALCGWNGVITRAT
jgi:transposase